MNRFLPTDSDRDLSILIIENCAIATVSGPEHPYGHLVAVGNRIASVGPGPVPPEMECRIQAADQNLVRRVDGRGCLLTPGLVNTHHHLYQWITRGISADHTLFEWLTTLYPVWGGITADDVHIGALGGLSHLALSGCTTTTDHHYVVPKDAGDVFEAEIHAALAVGLRFHPCRGSMDLGRSSGGLPPDHIVESLDEVLKGSEDTIARFHDPSPDSMCRIALAPCSPFSVTRDLLVQSANLARELGVRLHTHLAETVDEEDYCRGRFDCTPMEYMERVGWIGDDVWFAHTVHLNDHAINCMAHHGMAAAHCPVSNGRLGAGIARIPDMLNAGVTVGLGVDGAASNESDVLWEEMHAAVLLARAARGPRAMSVRQSLHMATLGGAKALGRECDIGSLEVGKLADLALWRLDGPAHSAVADPVVALVLGSRPPLERLVVDGKDIVIKDHVVTVDRDDIERRVIAARDGLLARTA